MFYYYPAKHKGKYSWPDFQVAVGSKQPLRPDYTSKKKYSYTESLKGRALMILSIIQYFYSGLCWVTQR